MTPLEQLLAAARAVTTSHTRQALTAGRDPGPDTAWHEIVSAAALDDLRAALDTFPPDALLVTPDSLDAAWAEAEAALPLRWHLLVGDAEHGYGASASGPLDSIVRRDRDDAGVLPTIIGKGSTPAAALRALSAKL